MNFPLPTSCRRTGLTAACAGIALWLLPLANAGTPKKPHPPEHKETYDQIQAVDPRAHTIAVATMVREVDAEGHPVEYTDPRDHAKKTVPAKVTGGVFTVKVSDQTEIQINGQAGTFQALAKGMRVDVTKGLDENTAARVVVGN
jgi:hypothetical protein